MTQQFDKPFPSIPHGWKTICRFTYEGALPRCIETMPTADAWYEVRNLIGICDSEETLQAYMEIGPRRD